MKTGAGVGGGELDKDFQVLENRQFFGKQDRDPQVRNNK